MFTESTTTESPIISGFQAQLESLEIPPNIDPKLLALWLEREREAVENQEKSKKLKSKSKSKYQHRKLNRLFAAYVGIIIFCLTIILGFVQQKETIEILNNACLSFLIYTVIGFFVGCVAEYCVNDSVETLLREIIRRSDEAAANAAKPEMDTVSRES
jgi:H+/gluconate symporter-like permease